MSYVPRYTSVGGVCAYLQLDGSDPNVQADVLNMLEYAEYLADGYMGTAYDPSAANTAKVFNGLGTNIITLSPVLSTLVKVERLDNDGVVDLEYTDVVPQPLNPKYGGYRWLARRRGALFPEGLACLKVTGTWGVPVIPAGIGFACQLITQHLFNMRDMNAFVRGEVNSERQVYQIAVNEMDFVPPTASKILDKFRVHAVELSE